MRELEVIDVLHKLPPLKVASPLFIKLIQILATSIAHCEFFSAVTIKSYL